MSETTGPKRAGPFKKMLRWTLAIFLVCFLLFFYFRYYWVFGEGAKAGELNYVVHKGMLFKTYEGKLIQVGLKGGLQGTMQSNEFIFSVEDPKVAERMMINSGLHFNLHYKEYMGALPWRGMSVFVVDSIISMQAVAGSPSAVPVP
ncbi:MAG TPA: hypothetical protein PK760_06080 [Flavobacteriales bacterium]|nr:hypothetical protein [Flavobacteriales bacterium]